MRRFAAIPAHPQKQYPRRWRLYHFCGIYYPIREVIPIAIYHWNIGIAVSYTHLWETEDEEFLDTDVEDIEADETEETEK